MLASSRLWRSRVPRSTSVGPLNALHDTFSRLSDLLGPGGEIHAVVDIISPRQVAAIVEEKYDIPISFGPDGGVSIATFYKFQDSINGDQMEAIWLVVKYFIEHSTCRGDPREAHRLLASEGLTLTSLEDILKEFHAAGTFNL